MWFQLVNRTSTTTARSCGKKRKKVIEYKNRNHQIQLLNNIGAYQNVYDPTCKQYPFDDLMHSPPQSSSSSSKMAAFVSSRAATTGSYGVNGAVAFSGSGVSGVGVGSGLNSTTISSSNMTRCGKCCYYCRQVTTFLFSHIGLCTLLLGYALVGAFTFQAIEYEHEQDQRRDMIRKRNELILALSNMTNHSVILHRDTWTREASFYLKKFELDFLDAVKYKGYNGNEDLNKANSQWSFSGALLYSIIVITTIGYGNVAPRTDLGKIVTILYAIIGIPLMLFCLSNIGHTMAHSFKFIYWKCCCFLCVKPKSQKRRERRRKRLLRAQRRKAMLALIGGHQCGGGGSGGSMMPPPPPPVTPLQLQPPSSSPLLPLPPLMLSPPPPPPLLSSSTGGLVANHVNASNNILPPPPSTPLTAPPIDIPSSSNKNTSSLRRTHSLRNYFRFSSSSSSNNGGGGGQDHQSTKNDQLSPTLTTLTPQESAGNQQRCPRKSNLARSNSARCYNEIDPTTTIVSPPPLSLMVSTTTTTMMASMTTTPTMTTPTTLTPTTTTDVKLPNISPFQQQQQRNHQQQTRKTFNNARAGIIANKYASISDEYLDDIGMYVCDVPECSNEINNNHNNNDTQSSSNSMNRTKKNSSSLPRRTPSQVRFQARPIDINEISESSNDLPILNSPSTTTTTATATPSTPYPYPTLTVDQVPVVFDNNGQPLHLPPPSFHATTSSSSSPYRYNHNNNNSNQLDSTMYMMMNHNNNNSNNDLVNHYQRGPTLSTNTKSEFESDLDYSDYSNDDDSDSEDKITKKNIPITVCLTLVVGYICGGAWFFSVSEEWSFLDASYFCFVTLSTIGFGDLVPGRTVLATTPEEGQMTLAICALYLLFGMALLAMSLNLVKEKVLATVRIIGERIGILVNDDDDYY